MSFGRGLGCFLIAEVNVSIQLQKTWSALTPLNSNSNLATPSQVQNEALAPVKISYPWWLHSPLVHPGHPAKPLYPPWSPELLLFLWNIIFNTSLNCISVCLGFRKTSNKEPFVYLFGGGGGEEDTLKCINLYKSCSGRIKRYKKLFSGTSALWLTED